MPRPTPPVILAYPGAQQSAVLGLSDILAFAGLHPLILSEAADKPASCSAILLPPAAQTPDPGGAPWITDWLNERARQGTLICSACVGVTWIAAARIDAGRDVTTHWGIGREMQRTWPDLRIDTDRLVIEYSDLVTAGGLMAWIDLALIVIERLAGHDTMLATARHFVVDPGRRDQRRFQRFLPDFDHGDQAILRAQKRIETTLAAQHRITDLATALGLSDRSFQRRFTKATGHSLTDYVQRLRVEQARNMLADTSASVAQIANTVGYGDVPAFHRVFLKIVGMPPSAFRKAVQAR
ncbi:GlxA family transcriptional regulator [Mameliella sediminis]|uniref:GlxA family transcriptional regulator n=1 Tax=Mameliella sediminis TaxID=2836866 RepID=UPI001C489115|nr:helix-turn-helix domain-containing protein [Mameliella sediminis]MBV7393593.1 helix-turn-helix domain-containing protein [Mameliella sediminis]